jgi:hypothetical protein
MKFNNNENINTLSTICIIITFLYSIILIVDELFNMTYFTYKYTYLYNYGTFAENFNNTQTIECETNRFNVYNNINKYFLYKDNFNKSYFNYLIIIIATLLTIIITIAYGVYFYHNFIHSKPDQCSFTPLEANMSYIKQFLRCICEDCHEFIPNCSFNYMILIMLLLIIPFSYLLKVSLNIDFTSNSNNYLLGFIYISLYLLLLFYYTYVIYTTSSSNKLNITLTFIIITIIFISSTYIFNYIYNKYSNKVFNTSQYSTSFVDIYKQLPPNKPVKPSKPFYNGEDLIKKFNYIKDGENKPTNYDIRKKIFEDYFTKSNNYDKEMKIYTEKYNIYKNTKMNFPEETSVINMIMNMLGLNNTYIIYMIVLLIFVAIVLYYINSNRDGNDNDNETSILNMSIKYLICIISIIVLLEAILYYNTYVNKYIIYEPLAHYKNDITVANTKLNLLLKSNDGGGFYKKLTNNSSTSPSSSTSANTKLEILEDIKRLGYDNTKFNYTNTSNINNNIVTIKDDTGILEDIPVDGYFKNILSTIPSPDYTDYNNPFINMYNNIKRFECINKNNINVSSFNFHYENNIITVTDNNVDKYYKWLYYKMMSFIYIYEHLILLGASSSNIKEYNDKIKKINDIIYKFKLEKYRDSDNDTDKAHKQKLFNYANTVSNAPADIDIEINKNINKIDFTKVSTAIGDSSNIISFSLSDRVTNSDTLKQRFKLLSPFFTTYNTYYNYIVDKKEYSLPTKITDNNGNEYNIYSDATDVFFAAPAANFKFISKNTETKTLTIDKKHDLKFTSDKTYTAVVSTSITELPLKCYYKTPDIKTIVLLVLYNKLVNLKTKFSYIPLQKKLLPLHSTSSSGKYENSDTVGADTLNKIWESKVRLYYKKFYSEPINNIKEIDNDTSAIAQSFLKLDPNTDAIAYLILLYNLYMIKIDTIEKDLRDTLDYIIYNNIDLTNFDNFKTDDNLKSLDSIKPHINYNNKNDNITIYNNNFNIISLILKLFKNLVFEIKNVMLKNINTSLCEIIQKTNKIDIEIALYKYITDNFKDPTFLLSGIPDIISDTTAVKENTYIFPVISKKDNINININIPKITELSQIISYYFNICVFLLNNLNIDDTSSVEMESIKDNFKFYNNNNYKIVQEQLTINCDYYNKYNKLDTKQLSYYQYNIENVSYNFIVLMIIFLIILGEPIFIKS